MAPELSIIVPVYRNATALPALHEQLTRVLHAMVAERAAGDYEMLFVNDACPEGSLAVLRDLARTDPRVAVLAMAENVGQNRSVLVGLAHARGQVAVVLDADLQDPPEAIPRLLKELRGEVGAVFAGRRGRYESGFRLLTSHLFKSLLHWLSRRRIPQDAGLFVAMKRPMIDLLINYRGPAPYVVGLMGATGLPLRSVPVERLPNPQRVSGYTTWKRLRLAISALITSTQVRHALPRDGNPHDAVTAMVGERIGARFGDQCAGNATGSRKGD